MRIQIIDEDGQLLWERGKNKGVACRAYVTDGTQTAIIDLLKDALRQAEGELSSLDEAHGVCDRGTPAP